MKNNKLKILIGAAGALLLLSCGKQADYGQAETIVGRHIARFTQPPQRIPSKVSVDAPLLGNGFMGVALSGTPEHQVFYVARNDFWRLKSAHNESYPAMLGKIELSIPGLQGASYLVEQRLYDAVTVARFAREDFAVTYKTYVAALDDVMVIEIGMEGEGTLEGNVQVSLPVAGKEIVEDLPLDRAFPEQREQSVSGGIHYITRAFEDSVDIPTKAAMALLTEGSPDGRFTLEPGKTVRLLCATSGNFKSGDCLAAAISKTKESADPHRLRVLEDQHRGWWKNYWEKSFVSIPDSLVEGQYYLSLYGTASASRDPDFPPGLLGTWVTQEQPAWVADYHLNYNHQAAFYALYPANRIEQATPFYAPLLAFMPRGKYYSEKIPGIPDGIYCPVGIGPLGIETTRWTPLMARYHWTKDYMENIEDEGMFWGQKSNASYAVANLSMQFYLTWDEEFTRKVYPFVRAAAVFWEKYLVYEDGRYVDYNDAIHEGTIGDKNPLLSLGLIRQTMRTATDMSELLGEDADKREKWMHIHDHMSQYPVFERGGKTVFRYTETGIEWVGGNTLGIQHIYPAGAIGLDSDPHLLAIARNTIGEMQRWLDSNGNNSFFPAAVRTGYHPDTILYHLGCYARHAFPNGFQQDNPHGVETLSTVPNTVNEMLCMGHQGVLRLFPVWNRSKDASFHQIRAEGAFLVSAKLEKGEVGPVTIVSEQGRELHLLNPWAGRRIKVKGPGGERQYEGKRIRISTEKGATYRLEAMPPQTVREEETPRHIIMVGFDGLSASCLNNGADMPTLRRLMAEGAWTLENRSVLPSSSAVNWSSMFMGAGPELHGYTRYDSRTPDLPSRVTNSDNRFPNIFGLYREKDPDAEIGLLFEWIGINFLVDTLALDYRRHTPVTADNPDGCTVCAVDYIREKKPNFCAVIYDQPDGTGHAKGWESPEYFATVNRLDGYLAQIIRAAEEAGIMDQTVIVVVADHGGIKTGHGGKTMEEMQTPLVFYGKGIKKGHRIQESTMIYDIAGTLARMMNVEQPQAWIARPISSIFE